MKKIVILLIVLMMVGIGFLSGCNENETEYSIVGTWADRETPYQFVFREDGTCAVIIGTGTIDATYTINATVISITASGYGATVDYTYKFLSEDILSLTNSLTGLEKEAIFDRTK